MLCAFGCGVVCVCGCLVCAVLAYTNTTARLSFFLFFLFFFTSFFLRYGRRRSVVQTATGTEYKRKQHAQKCSREAQTNGMQRLGSRRALIHDSVATAGACFLHGGSLEDTGTRGKTNASRLRIAAVRGKKILRA